MARLRRALDEWAPAPGFDVALRPPGAPHDAADSRFWRLVAREAVLALIVFACTALLGQLTPSRHPHHHEAVARIPLAAIGC